MKIAQKIRTFLRQECAALESAIKHVDHEFERAIELILNCKGKLIVTGVGKSGLVGQKISATLSSTGTPAIYMHSTDAIHGDLGRVSRKDIVLAISHSGYTAETIEILPHIRNIGAKLIALVGDPASQLAKSSDVVLNMGSLKEAGHLGLAPTSSALVTMAFGDALASVLAELRGFKPEDFAMFHPGGQLGRKLLLQVSDLMHKGKENPMLKPNAPLITILKKLTDIPLGGVNIVQDLKAKKLIGIITDGDIRRTLSQVKDYQGLIASDIMVKNPVYVRDDVPAIRAFELMENRKSQISVLPVLNENKRVVGMIRLHDLVSIGFKSEKKKR